ncbi:hypothetical protein D3C72_965160 [compost metagenome]
MGLVGVGRDSLGIQCGGIDVHAGARLHGVGDDEANDERKRGEHQEVDHGLAGHAANLLHVVHAGDAGRDCEEDDGSDDHLDEADEAVAERFQLFAESRIEMAERDTGDDGHQNLKIQVLVKWHFGVACGHGCRIDHVFSSSASPCLYWPPGIAVSLTASRRLWSHVQYACQTCLFAVTS